MSVLEKLLIKRILSIVVLIAVIAGVAFGGYVGAVKYIQKVGIGLKPSRDYAVHEVSYYLQNDPIWAGDSIGKSGSKMGGAGCLITCVASAISNLGVDITPQELNDKLTAAEGYQSDNLIWYKINEVVPEVDYEYKRIFGSGAIERDLQNGRLPIVNVKYHGSGVTHWLLVIGASGGEFLVYDPINAELEPIPLSAHGKVYAYRVLVKADN